MLIGCYATAEVCRYAASAANTACYHLYSTQIPVFKAKTATSICHSCMPRSYMDMGLPPPDLMHAAKPTEGCTSHTKAIRRLSLWGGHAVT